MANYYTEFALSINVTPEEAKWLDATLEGENHEADSELSYCSDWKFDEKEGVFHFSSEGGSDDVEKLAELLQTFIKKFNGDPIAFEYAFTCSKHKPDAFGGGACIVTKNDIEWMTTRVWLWEKTRDQRFKWHDRYALKLSDTKYPLTFHAMEDIYGDIHLDWSIDPNGLLDMIPNLRREIETECHLQGEPTPIDFGEDTHRYQNMMVACDSLLIDKFFSAARTEADEIMKRQLGPKAVSSSHTSTTVSVTISKDDLKDLNPWHKKAVEMILARATKG